MLQLIGWVVLAIVVAAALCALALVVLPAGEQIAPALRDEPVWSLPPERSLIAEDVDTVRLPVALRGYRFAETDQLLDRLAGELRERDAEIARLRGGSVVTAEPADVQPGDDAPSGAEPSPEPSDDAAYRPRD